jgi:LuxR family transcriptional regulator
MSISQQIVRNYSIKYEKKIGKICSPLKAYLNIPVFTYCFVEADGRFGYVSNVAEFTEYYFENRLHQINPYFSHPRLFRSGHSVLPCTVDEEINKSLCKRFHADHLFVTLRTNGSAMEFFIFAEENKDEYSYASYFHQLDLFHKFGNYFKREAKELIGRMRAEQFNIKQERGSLFESCAPVPLVNQDPKILKFLKAISPLSAQEERCLKLFQEGNSAQATAAIMNLSRRTVESYFENIKNKLGCASKYDLLNY